MKRLLYISGTSGAAIRKDGESLVVSVDGQADRRYPFRLLSQVVLRGDTQVHTAALWGLMTAGVPVSLHNLGGEPCGFALPFRKAERSLSDDAECLLERCDGRMVWSNWMQAREREELRRLVGASERGRWDLRPGKVEARLRQLGGTALEPAIALRRGLVALELAESFVKAGLGPAYIARLEREMEWMTGLTRLLVWEWWFGVARAGRGLPDAMGEWTTAHRAEVRRVEEMRDRVAQWLRGAAWHSTGDMRGW
jgi:hypothetical protein